MEDHEEPNDTCIHQWKTQGHGANHEQGNIGQKFCFQSIVSFTYHIFQKAQVSSNKMVHKGRNHFLAQFFDWLLKNFNQSEGDFLGLSSP